MELEDDETDITITVSDDNGNFSTTYTALVTREGTEQQDPQQQDPPQQDPPSEGSMAEDCRNDLRDGLIAHCGISTFATTSVELDRSYTINWSEWDSDHPQVTGYSVRLAQFMYRMYADENGSIHDYYRLSQIYESCEFVGGEWDCQGSLASIDD